MFGTQEASKTCLYKHQGFPIFYFKAPDGRWYEYWYQMPTRTPHPPPPTMSWLPTRLDFTEMGWCETIKSSTELEFLVLVGQTPEQSWRKEHTAVRRRNLIKKWWKPRVLDVIFLSIILCYAIRVYLSGGRG